jgi:hypothetical protein
MNSQMLGFVDQSTIRYVIAYIMEWMRYLLSFLEREIP